MRVGLVGAGFMGGVHLNAYAGIPQVEVVGVADARIESAVAGAEMVGARPYASYEELVAAEGVEVVDVCLPTAFHRDLAVRAAGEGRHVILEKPIARTMKDAQEILEAFSADGPRLFVGHVVRFFPAYVGIKQKIDAGDLGTVGVVRTSRRSPFLLGWNDWYADWRVSGGVLLDLVIHDFDFLRWALGEVERVYARGMLGREYNRLDYALVTLRFQSGAIAHVEGHWGYPAPFNYSIEVAGSKALLTVDSTEPAALQLIGGAPGEVPDLASGKSPYEKELEHFIHCIESGEAPIVQAQDACEALRIGLAATESVLTGESVTLGGSG
ncbi:NADH-dependent dyhydrogenase [uncultured Rubrobacteraceae bacterium]|uniref:NADH-dependent dyhydrogenase n=1 Tax=uncultured Rubrobacteraceae bacterium TaxID=349277 RepID=A0A6J4QJM9_9ACTN|nr:NADH-dependent dyhydrogenase [uncultured Rubrobacteraceae bacterium]